MTEGKRGKGTNTRLRRVDELGGWLRGDIGPVLRPPSSAVTVSMAESASGFAGTPDGHDWGARPARGGEDVPPVVFSAHRRARLVVAIEDLALHQEVLDFLERDPRLDVVGAASDIESAVRLIGERPVDSIVICPSLARKARHPAAGGNFPTLLVVAEEMTVPVLRDALELGAGAVFAWPEEREELADVAAVPHSHSADVGMGRGRVIALLGARGGAGSTFVATNLAAVLADRGVKPALVDMDSEFAELLVALGMGRREGWRTIADLVPVAGELSPDHVDDALYRHPRGFSVLLSAADHRPQASPGLYAAAVALLAGSFPFVLLHVRHGLGDMARTALSLGDDVLLVAGPDLVSLHNARRMRSLAGTTGRTRWRLVLNRRTRGEVRPQDFDAIAGITQLGTIRFDRSIPARQSEGELLPARARRAGKDVRSLAAALTAEAALSPGES